MRPLALDVNPARLDRIKGELLVADLRTEDTQMGADRQLTELAGKLDASSRVGRTWRAVLLYLP